ncbi:MAG TPA: hypothetical protein VGL07_16965 [Buttiauxella sp.]|jgi:hypothetical protein
MSDNNQTSFFVQHLTLAGRQIPVERIAQLAYIETSDMSGPQLIIRLNNNDHTYNDNMKVQKGTLIEASLGDPDGGGTIFKERFTVVVPPMAGPIIEINAFSETTFKLKTPSSTTRFFVEKQPAAILRELAPGAAIDADTFHGLGTYHLNVGGLPSKLLRQIAKDHGALCWWSRGKLHFKDMARLSGQSAMLTIEANNAKARHSMLSFKILSKDYELERQHKVRYVSYSMTEGLRSSKGGESDPIRLVPAGDVAQLNNLRNYFAPALEFDTPGFGAITPGYPIKCVIHRDNSESSVDESMPAVMVATKVTHFDTGDNYRCFVEMGVFNGD